jgi:hypothetical protein
MLRRMKRAAWLLLLAACSTEKPAAPKACCEQPKIPAGVTPFTVVGDDVTGPSDGEKVVLQVGLGQPAKREQLYPVLQTLYRHAMTRHSLEPISVTANVYATEAAARSGGDGWLGRLVRGQGDVGPKCENKVPYDFPEQVGRAFAAATGRADEEDPNDTCHLAEKKKVARIDDKFTHKPAYKVDAARGAVEITFPYLELGRDEYIKDLRFNSAMRDWTEYVTSFFRKVEGLKELTFVGVHEDQPVVKITTTRAQFDSSLAGVQETVAAHSAITFATLGMHKKDDKGASKEQEAFHNKTYKTALAALPKNQVSISPKLK